MAVNCTTDDVIVGGGIIGLSIAYELAKRGRSVVVLETEQFGGKASWAGAGILPPANPQTAIHPQEQLEAISHDLHEQWSAELKHFTGIDNGFAKCGGLYVARTPGESAALNGMELEWRQRQITYNNVTVHELPDRIPLLSGSDALSNLKQFRKATWVPGESQLANPQHLEALVAACRKLKVGLHEYLSETKIELSNQTIESISASCERFVGNNYVFAAGPWTQRLVEPIGVELPMQPVRGQIVQYKIPIECRGNGDWPIVNEGSRYLVPRRNGHVLAGATIEEVGFDCQTTEQEVADLRRWAESLSHKLDDSTFRQSWAGLRPGTYDGFPYLGPLGGFQNAFVATGHFKSGLHLSTGTAVVMADLVEGNSQSIDLMPFSPARAASHQSTENR